MAVLAFLAAVIFWFQFRHLDEEEDALNALPEGNHLAAPRDPEEQAVIQAVLPEKV